MKAFGSVFCLAVGLSLQVLSAAPYEGYVIQWGWNSAYALPVPAKVVASNATMIAAGVFHSLAVQENGTVYGWGGNSGLVLGSKFPENVVTNGFVRIDGSILTNVVGVAAAREFSLGLKKDGTIVSWGNTHVPRGLTNIIAVAAGGRVYNWALQRNGRIVGWDSERYGDGVSTVDGLSNIVSISFCAPIENGPRGAALRQDGTVLTWGRQSDNKEFIEPPVGLSNVIAVAVSGAHSLALKANGTVVGWGWNKVGEATGEPTTNSPNGLDFISSGQVHIGGRMLSNIVSIAANSGYSMALRKDGTIAAWGRMINDLYPVMVPEGLSNVVAIAAGPDYSLAITTNRAVAERFSSRSTGNN